MKVSATCPNERRAVLLPPFYCCSGMLGPWIDLYGEPFKKDLLWEGGVVLDSQIFLEPAFKKVFNSHDP